jgi:hypothetical protein
MAKVADLYAEIRGDNSSLKGALKDSTTAMKQFQDQLTRSGLASGQTFDEFIAGNKQLEKTSSGFSKAAVDLITLNQVLELGRKAVQGFKQAWEFASEGAQIQSLGIASTKVAMTYGASMTDIKESIKSASMNTISDYDAMKSASKAMLLGVSADADDLGNLMEIAAFRAKAMGLDTTEAFERIVTGIGRRSTKILDDLGIITNTAKAQETYAASIGKTVDQLSEADRIQALFNDTLRAGNELLSQAGGLTFDAATGYQRVNAAYQDFWNNTKQNAAMLGLPLIASSEEIKGMYEEEAALAMLSGDYEGYVEARKKAALQDTMSGKGGLPTGLKLPTKLEFENERWARQVIDSMKKATPAIEEAKFAYEGLNEETALQIGLSGDVARIQDQFDEAMRKAGRSTENQATAFNNLTESYEDFIITAVQGSAKDAKTTMSVAYAFGEIDKNSIAAITAIEMLTQAYEGGIISIDQYLRAMEGMPGAIQMLDSLSADIPINVRVNYIVNGVYRNMPIGVATQLGLLPKSGGASYMITKEGYANLGGKHGGSFIGMQHGGIVPPGFSNDGMPVFVSSGERLDVTPAGNKDVTNTALLSKLDDLNYKLDGLPRAMKEAVLQVV